MSFVYDPDNVLMVVTGVGQCVYEALVESPGGQPDRYCVLVPGQIAWDDCQCGQLAQSIGDDFPSSVFPIQATDLRQQPCGPGLMVVQVTLSLTRCIPIPGDNGRAPRCDKLFTAAEILMWDRWLTRSAVTCCLMGVRRDNRLLEFAIGATSPVGPEGQCAGFEMTYTLGFGGVCCE